MKLLDINKYDKLIEPLKEVTINNFFARFVVEKKVNGLVYVDDTDNPKTFYVIHPYGISLLFGDCTNEEFNQNLRNYALNVNKQRSKHEWMQAFPDKWHMVLNELFEDCMIKYTDNIENLAGKIIELNTRVNFKFVLNRYLNFREGINLGSFNIVRTNKKLFKEMKGSVIPHYFWDSADDFCMNGIGFSLLDENRLASTAYSAFILGYFLELGIETIEEFRGKGFAQYVCSALIDYCLDHGYEPVWSCKFENTASYKLAQKLGFEPVAMFPFYRLSN
jgi:GNAT superfamily N-acetyltransferase